MPLVRRETKMSLLYASWDCNIWVSKCSYSIFKNWHLIMCVLSIVDSIHQWACYPGTGWFKHQTTKLVISTSSVHDFASQRSPKEGMVWTWSTSSCWSNESEATKIRWWNPGLIWLYCTNGKSTWHRAMVQVNSWFCIIPNSMETIQHSRIVCKSRRNSISNKK